MTKLKTPAGSHGDAAPVERAHESPRDAANTPRPGGKSAAMSENREDPSVTTAHATPEALLDHAAWARRLAAHLVRDDATADDLVQDTWVAAMKRPPATDRPIRPWLAAVMRKLAIRRRRGDVRRGQRETAVAAAGGAGEMPDPRDVAARLEMQALVAGLVRDLDEPFRSTVYLRYFDGLDAAEIARRTGVPAGTVRWRLHRGLVLLRERLDAHHGGDRRGWVLALTPLATGPALPHGDPGASGDGAALTTGAAAAGAIAMASWAKVAAAVLVLVGGGAVWWTVADGPGAVRDEAVAFRPEDRRADTPSAAPQVAPRADRRASVPGATPAEPGVSEAGRDGRDPSKAAAASPRMVHGRVVDADAAPIQGATVRVGDGADAERSASDGTGEFAAPVPASSEDDVVILVSAPGHATARMSASLAGDARRVAVGDVVLGAGGSVAGVVTDEAGAPLGGAWVAWADPDDRWPDAETFAFAASHGPLTWIRTTSAADGTFTLAGVPAGRQRIAAGADGRIAVLSGAIEVRRATTSEGVRLAIAECAAADMISGVVRADDGAPVAATLRLSYSSERYSGSTSESTDERGAFRFRAHPGAAYDVTAVALDKSWAPATVRGLRGGAAGVEIVLSRSANARVVVTAQGGAAVPRFRLSAIDAASGAVLVLPAEIGAADGTAEFAVPAGAYRLVVDADGFALFEREMTGATTPARIDVALAPVPGISGRVLRDGAPVRGARVALTELVPDNEVVFVNGLRSFRETDAVATAETDADGRYLLTLRESGRFVVRVEADGAAPAESGVLETDVATGARGVDVVLDDGGAIRGRVTVGAGRSPGGIVVAATRGDGRARTVRTAADGAFGFERCTPGAWAVRIVEREVPADEILVERSGGRRAFETNCVVEAGKTAEVVLSRDGVAKPTLRGLALIDGTGAAGMRVTVRRGAGMLGAEQVAAVEVAPDGTFSADVPDADRYVVQIPTAHRWVAALPVDVAVGGAQCRLDVRTGRLVVTGLAAEANELALLVEIAGGVALAEIRKAADGRAEFANFPEGHVRLIRIDREKPTMDLRTWQTVAEGDLRANGELELRAAK